jgi:hypothetical protein
MTIDTITHLAGVITPVGAALFTMADVLILAHHVGPLQDLPATANEAY